MEPMKIELGSLEYRGDDDQEADAAADDNDSACSRSTSSDSSESEEDRLEEAPPGLGLQLASRAEVSRMDPLELRFSQMKMRHLFGDGRRVADTVPEITVVKCSKDEQAEYKATYKLEVPFPFIEVIRWRCKLRDEKTGRPIVNPKTGEEMFDSQEEWFTLDNRRLYCLQEAALRIWPERCVAPVSVIISGPHHYMRELRKFRTLDLGKSINIGSKSDKVAFERWSWASAKDKLEAAEDGMLCTDTFKHLARLKPDDFGRIEISKKISAVLRRNVNDVHGIAVDDDGWVSVDELLGSEFIGCSSMQRFMQVVEESNRQKHRYEMKDTSSGKMIRAAGKKSRANRNKQEPRQKKEKQPSASKKDADKETAKKSEKSDSSAGVLPPGLLPTGKVEGKAEKASEKKKEAAQKEKEPSGIAITTTNRTSSTAAVKAKATPKPKPEPKKEAAKEMPKAKTAIVPVNKMPMHPLGAAAGMNAMQLAFFQQMQAWHHMLAVSTAYQMQVRIQLQQLMMLRMAQMASYEYSQMAWAQEMTAMEQVMHDMEEWYAGYDGEEGGDADGLGNRIKSAFESALQRAGAAELERSGDEPGPRKPPKAKALPTNGADIQAKIDEALKAAQQRNSSRDGLNTEAKPWTPAAVINAKAKCAALPHGADLQAKIAQALEAAQKRGATTSEASIKSGGGYNGKGSKPSPAKAAVDKKAPATQEDFAAKVAEALQAAKSRQK
eukprot:TRINITY_DN122684_c0_g1_i1.p1 TRINITY_DN122684_c0_g1~~TRINITY_DN122684_c0_g1_i1.p1  ORF type:complete len:748 (-),score=218.16 TRINITY_DN122684_c0_g1_i1:205-2373(-)